MKKYLLLCVILTLLMNSCYSYKEISLSDIEKNKIYYVQLTNGKKPIKLSYTKTPKITDSLLIEKNDKLFRISVKEIESIKKRKISTLPTIAVAALSSIGIVLFVDQLGKEETLTETLIPDSKR